MFSTYLQDKVVVQTATTDKWGSSTYSSKTVKARVEYKTRLVRDSLGEQVVSAARVYFKASQSLSYGSRIQFDGRAHDIISIGKIKDFKTRTVYADVS